MLNQDIDEMIFRSLPMTDKRSFLRTCKSINQFSIQMPEMESQFHKMLNDIGFFCDRYYSGLYYPLYKFTIEFIYDGYDVPERYINVENRILHQFPKIYKRLAERGNLCLIKKMLQLNRNTYVYRNSDFVLYGAAKTGNIKILKWMIRHKYKRAERTTAHAAKHGKLDILKWLVKHGFPVTDLACYYAAGNGHSEVLDYLIDGGYKIDAYMAAHNGRFDIVKRLHAIDPELIYDICEGAIHSGHLDMVKYAFENGGEVEDDGIFCKDVNVLSWLINNGHIKPNHRTVEEIAWGGNLECLQLLYHRKYRVLTKEVFAKAVSSRNIEMINWLHDLKCPVGKSATYAAVDSPSAESKERGSLPILKMLVNWGCPLKDSICSTAAYYGDLEMLQYLVSVGCKLTPTVISSAAGEGHLHIIIWARKHGCEWDEIACRETIDHDHLNVLKWLRGIDRDRCELKSDETKICPWDDKFGIEATCYERTDMLQFALDNCYKFSAKARKEAKETKVMRDSFRGCNR